jgi:hypothetical protein
MYQTKNWWLLGLIAVSILVSSCDLPTNTGGDPATPSNPEQEPEYSLYATVYNDGYDWLAYVSFSLVSGISAQESATVNGESIVMDDWNTLSQSFSPGDIITLVIDYVDGTITHSVPVPHLVASLSPSEYTPIDMSADLPITFSCAVAPDEIEVSVASFYSDTGGFETTLPGDATQVTIPANTFNGVYSLQGVKFNSINYAQLSDKYSERSYVDVWHGEHINYPGQ